MRDKILNSMVAHQKSIDNLLKNQDLIQRIELAAKKIVESYKRGGKVVLFGNGGSAADAQHIVGELINKFYLERPMLNAMALHTNTSVTTAIANDYSYDEVFSKQIEYLVDYKDVVIGISTSGKSMSVNKAMQVARNKGALTIGFTGEGQRPINAYSDIIIDVPSNDTPRIQEMHILIGHIICQLVEHEIFGNK